MSDTVIKVENLSKQYRLGLVGTGTMGHDLKRWWHLVRGKEDPYLKIGETNMRESKGETEYVWALRDINFEVEQGEVFGIIGKNGAGKSTLLKILSKVTGPTTGSIKAKGRIASLLEVGTGFHPELTGRENIYLNGTILGMTKVEVRRKLDEIVDFAGVARYVDTPVKRYSSGMKVRLGFAVAAHLEPEILIVDEVLAVGDAEFQKKAIGKMQEVSHEGGRTVLFVSHNMASIKTLCSRGIILKNGSIHKEGEIQNIINEYISDNSNSLLTKYIASEKKNKDIWIDQASIGVEGKQVDRILSGQNCEITIKYTSKGIKGKGEFYIGLYNSFGEKIFHLSNIFTDTEAFEIKEKGTITCVLPKIPLVEGKYIINLSLIVNKIEADRIQNAFLFHVENGDFYGNGKLPNIKENKFLVEQNWKFF